MITNINTKYIRIKWRFSLNGFSTFALENMLNGDLVLIQDGTSQTVKMYNGATVEEFQADEGWSLSEVITTNTKGVIIDYPERNVHQNRLERYYYAVIKKCCGSTQDCTVITTTVTAASQTASLNAPDNSYNYQNCFITVNGIVQEIGTSLLSFDNGLITFNPEYGLLGGDIIVFRKFCGDILNFATITADSTQFQLPAGFENASLITVNGIVQEVHTSLHISSITNGLITFNPEYGLFVGDIIVFRNL